MSTGSRVARVVWVAAALAGLCLAGSAAVIARAAAPTPAAAHLAATAGLFVAAVILRVDVRVGSSRLVCVWGDTAFVLALQLLPLPWVVPVSTVGKATAMTVLRQPPVKAIYNTAAHVVAATVAAVAVGGMGGTPAEGPARLGVLLAAGVLYDLLCSGLAAAIVAVANGSSPIRVWLASLGMQALTMAGNLTVTGGALALSAFDPRLILALPPAAVVLHHAYQTVQRGRSERESGRRLARAISAVGHLDRPTVLARTAAHAADLLSAAGAEVVRYTAASVAEVHVFPDGGPPQDACRWTQAVALPATDGEPPVGEIRVHFTQPVRLAGRDHAALKALAAASSNALAAADAHARLAHLITHDPLTGLPTRQLLVERINAHLGRARAGTPVGMILIGLVDFAELARALGDGARDHLLRDAARRLRQATTDGEIPARLDGFEFGVFVPDIASFDHLSGRADSLLAALTTAARLPLGTVSLNAAAGIAYATRNTIDAPELLRQATVSLAQTRQSLAPVEYYSAADDTSSGPTTLMIAAELQHALGDDQLTLFYEPIIDLTDGTPVAAEAIVHWRHPTRGLRAPHQFLPILEHATLLTPYTDWLLHKALTDRASWNDLDAALPVSINLPAICLLDRELTNRVADALYNARLHPHQLMIEVTEPTFGAMTKLDPVLEDLSDLGVRIAIDDFGTGHSSLTRLFHIPASDLKISPWIVEGLPGSPQACAIVAAAAEIGRNLDLRVIAVGVRTLEHLLAARDAGVHAAQGDAIARPDVASTTYARLSDRTNRFDSERSDVIRLHPRHDPDDPA